MICFNPTGMSGVIDRRIKYLAAVPVLFALNGCAHLPEHTLNTHVHKNTVANAQPMPEPVQTTFDLEIAALQQLQPQLKLTKQLPTEASTDPLLAGISATDIHNAKRLARINYQRSWKTIEQRSRFVRSRLLETLGNMHAPASLQVIPVVESTYNPYALSHTGAVGLWQLMPATARSLGIRSGRHINGRRDIAQSTSGAVNYLQQLHQRFNSWPLAIAAYNIGPNALARRLQKHAWTQADGLDRMPISAPTRRYVQNIIGLIALLNDHSFSFPEPYKTRALALNAPVDIHLLAQISGMPENDIFRFNPCLNRAQYLHQTVTIHVPESRYNTIRSKLALAGPKFATIHVRKGDSLWSIARKNRTSVATLKYLNKRIGKYLHTGQMLKVPANHLSRASASINPLIPSNRRIRYRVRSGDSLWRIAHRFGTTPKAIARANRISMKRMIRAGDTLWVYARERPS